MVLPHAIDTKNATAVSHAVKAAFASIGAEASGPLIDRVFREVEGMFAGRYPGYQAIDMVYHNLEHTLQASLCLCNLLVGRHHSGDRPAFTSRDAELALIAALLHDAGYFKVTGDNLGTGAKYTFVHERRSCEFARSYLPSLGVASEEIEDICAAIICTGPRGNISKVPFRREVARLTAFMLVTADYLAQMSDPDYADKLESLFREFQEGYEYEGVPASQRQFGDFGPMLEGTPQFWSDYVWPMLDFEAGGVHRYLSTAGQPNPYLTAVEANLTKIRQRLQVGAGHN